MRTEPNDNSEPRKLTPFEMARQAAGAGVGPRGGAPPGAPQLAPQPAPVVAAGWRARARKLLPWIIYTEVAIVAVICAMLIWQWVRQPRPPIPVRWTEAPLPALVHPRVMVCKSWLVMTVFDGNEPAKSYRVAVGENPGHKQREGDKRTPEGELKVCMKNPQSKYVLSLGLGYPGVADAARGLGEGLITRTEHDAIVRAAREGTQPPWNTALGGEIMIHGCRNGRKHTLGCIAVEDDEIREIYPRLPVGTPVTILP